MGLDVFIQQVKTLKENIRKKELEIEEDKKKLRDYVKYIEKSLLEAGMGGNIRAYADSGDFSE